MAQENALIEIHLYGRLRRFAPEQDTGGDSVVQVPARPGDSIGQLLAELGIQPEETSNIFLNGELSALSRPVQAGDRLGVFPDDMALLYKWYFRRQT